MRDEEEGNQKERMHYSNAWLPPPVAERCGEEGNRFSLVVQSVKEAWRPQDPDSSYATLKWISVIDLYIKARSEVAIEDIETLVGTGFDIVFASQDKLYVQVRWGSVLTKLLKKYRKKLSLTVPWRLFYNSLMQTHFTRKTGAEGWRLRQRHFETITSLVRYSRVLFPPGSAAEIWAEFGCFMENPWHNASFEGAGFVCLFLPMKPEYEDIFTVDWINSCLELWGSIPNCHFWDSQWADVIARCIRSYRTIDWENFLPILFTRYLNMFEVPVANGNGSYPFSMDVPRNTRFLFSGRVATPAKAIAKAIVYLLKPGSSAQEHFEKLGSLLEQFYHPSNGGRWTYSLERLLQHLVVLFKKRLLREQQSLDLLILAEGKSSETFLGRPERVSFVKVVLQFIDRAQYSKNDSLAETAALATSTLSYIEPLLVLPSLLSRFQLALETLTATHQLKTAVLSVAFCCRALCLASRTDLVRLSSTTDDTDSCEAYRDLLTSSLSNALLGMDANDPPKTSATMQLIGAIFSNLSSIDDDATVAKFLPNINFSEWLDEFLYSLFNLLLHLEPNSVINEGSTSSTSSGTFLVEDGPYYFCMLEVLLGRLSKPLYMQALNKISKFVRTNILPGAIAEIGLLCCACVHSFPEEAIVQIVEPLLTSIITSLKGTPVSGFGGGAPNESFSGKATLPPGLEVSVNYQLRVLSVAVSYSGSTLLQYKEQLKQAIASAFNAPSLKVNCAGNHLLRSVLNSLILYYPIEQYRCSSCLPTIDALEEWINTKDYERCPSPTWHIPNEDEISFSNELLGAHFESALNDFVKLCQTKNNPDLGILKEHLQVLLLRIESCLQGVLSCLPDFNPLARDGVKNLSHRSFIIAGSSGAIVGSSELRERAAEVVHIGCKYLCEERSDDSVLLILLINIIDSLANFGSLEYDEWSNHRQAWKLDSASVIEPAVNLMALSRSKGKRRPRWALIDKAVMHSSWRSSQASYHKFRVDSTISPSDHVLVLLDDLLNLSLHNYETVRAYAGKALMKLLKRFPSLIMKCVPMLTKCLVDPGTSEHSVLGACAILSSRTVFRQLTLDSNAFSSFILGILGSSHHESLKEQKAINELFVKYNIQFSGVSKNIYNTSEDSPDGMALEDLLFKISSMSLDTNGLHWRYSLMVDRMLLLLSMSLKGNMKLSSKLQSETAGHFLRSLKSQSPPARMLAISALNVVLQESPHRLSLAEQFSGGTSPLEDALNKVFKEKGFFDEVLDYLSHDHIISDADNVSSRNRGTSVSAADKSITRFYFDFAAAWPRTPTWISMIDGDTFYPSFARIFKRLVQECGLSVLEAIRSPLEESLHSKERAKQCVAAEALAGVLHSDITGLVESWDDWVSGLVEKVILQPTVDSTPEWAACVRYAVTGKGKYGIKVPILRQRILECLAKPLPKLAVTNVITKRYALLAAALTEISPTRMQLSELQFHESLLSELLDSLDFSSAQVREAVGVSLCVLCSNIRLRLHSRETQNDMDVDVIIKAHHGKSWDQFLVTQASELAITIQSSTPFGTAVDEPSEESLSNDDARADVKWMETILHFTISSLKSGRVSYLLDVIVGLLFPIMSLQETTHKDLSVLAKATYELLKWQIFPRQHLEKTVAILLSLANDSNWRTKLTTLTFLHIFMYRHNFLLSNDEKQLIWSQIEKLLKDNQVEVRERAAGVLAGLMRSGDEDLVKNFRERAIQEASLLYKNRKIRKKNSDIPVASLHGSVLALVALVLSVPYDIPSWLPETVTLLAKFIGESSPVKTTVTKAVAEFRRTHADTWLIQKEAFTEEQLEVLADTSSSSSYFA